MDNGHATAVCLEGLKVLDFTWWGAGPFATKYLADYGAEVVKVESRTHPDLIRLSEPYRGGKPGINNSAMFLHFNTSKKSVTVNVREPRGLALVKRLVRWADVVVENFSPSTMERMGLGYEVLREIKPDIILVSASSAGQAGVETEMRGHALVAAALGGHFFHTGYPDGAPTTPSSIGWADIVQPMITASAVLAAVDYRDRTGEGQWIDVSQLEVMAGFIAPAVLDHEVNGRVLGRPGNRHPEAAPHGAFRCLGEDRWCALAVFDDEQWRSLCRVLGDPAWAADPKLATLAGRKEHEDELERRIGEWTRQRTAEEVMERLQAAGVAAGIVQTPAELVDVDPQVRARQSFVRMAHPVIGECGHPAPAAKLSRTPARLKTSPLLGEHTEWACRELLGLSEEELAELQAAGVFS